MKKKILLVDNVRSILEHEKGLLERDIFQIFTATSGQEALDVHKKEKADIIVMGLQMSGMGGDEVCRVIRQDPASRHVPIILATLLNDEAEIERRIARRAAFKKEKNYAAADAERAALAAAGVVLEDGPAGTTWRRS